MIDHPCKDYSDKLAKVLQKYFDIETQIIKLSGMQINEGDETIIPTIIDSGKRTKKRELDEEKRLVILEIAKCGAELNDCKERHGIT